MLCACEEARRQAVSTPSSPSQDDAFTMMDLMDQGDDDREQFDQGVLDTFIPTDPDTVTRDPLPAQLYRLTQAQYKNIIHSVFGAEIQTRFDLEPDFHLDGFATLGAAMSSISARGIEQYEEAAYFIAEQAIEPAFKSNYMPCEEEEQSSESCLQATLEYLGVALWRRPLRDEEQSMLRTLTQQIAQETSFEQGMKYLIALMLQSPYFLFRIEQGYIDEMGMHRLNAWELASKMSFLLWNTIADQELRTVAGSGALLQNDEYVRQIERMLADPKAQTGIDNFFYEYLRLDELQHLRKDPNVFIHMQPQLGQIATQETLALARRVVLTENQDMRHFFTSQNAYLDPLLAAIYDVPAPSAEGFEWTTLDPQSSRRGFFGQVSFLALYAHPVSTSATLRGKFVRQKLLCGVIPPPPANVDTSIPEPSPDLPTLKDRLASHLQEPSCASCHRLTDPIGLAFEQFDGIGRFRTMENDHVIDVSGDLDQVPFTTLNDLSDLILTHPDWTPCMVKTFYHYVLGYADIEEHADYLQALTQWWPTQEYRLQALLIKIMTHPQFTHLGDSTADHTQEP